MTKHFFKGLKEQSPKMAVIQVEGACHSRVSCYGSRILEVDSFYTFFCIITTRNYHRCRTVYVVPENTSKTVKER